MGKGKEMQSRGKCSAGSVAHEFILESANMSLSFSTAMIARLRVKTNNYARMRAWKISHGMKRRSLKKLGRLGKVELK